MGKRVVAIVLFGGVGERFHSPIPKQFCDVGGRTLMGDTLVSVASLPFLDSLYVVSHPEYMEKTEAVIRQEKLDKVKAIISGGASREESVYEGLLYLSSTQIENDDVVLICDGDRPQISGRVFSDIVDAARKEGGAVPVIPETDSLLASFEPNRAEAYLDRSSLYRVQTPQGFLFEPLWKAFQKAHKKGRLASYSDDGSLFLGYHHHLATVAGEESNIKITTPVDLSSYLQGRNKE